MMSGLAYPSNFGSRSGIFFLVYIMLVKALLLMTPVTPHYIKFRYWLVVYLPINEQHIGVLAVNYDYGQLR